jgi:hypothetical protein
MAYNVLLISEEKLKQSTSINENVDSSELRFCILQSQTVFIQEALGTNLYNHILGLVETGDISLPANINYKTLLDNYIQPTLIAYSYYLGLDNFFVKWVNIGLTSNRSEQGQPIDFKTFQYLKSNAKNQAEFSNNLLVRHLIFKSGNYPEYNNGNLNDGQLPPIPQAPFKSPMTLPGSGFYWKRKALNWGYPCGSPLCADSPFPSWYGNGPNNSPNTH